MRHANRTDQPVEEQLRQVAALLDDERDEEALGLLQPLADAGVPRAQTLLAWTYAVGRGHSPDLRLAEELYRVAAGQGCELAQFYLGVLLLEGGRTDEGLSLLEGSASLGFSPAAYRLGIYLLKNSGSRREALQHLQNARDAGHIFATVALARETFRSGTLLQKIQALATFSRALFLGAWVGARTPSDERAIR